MAQKAVLNWQKYIGQYDMIYEMPSRIWQDGTPLGNGSLGALAYEPGHLEWVITKNNVWDYRLPKFKRYSLEQVREIAESKTDFMGKMYREDIHGTDRYPCPKFCGQLRLRLDQRSIITTPPHNVSKRLNLYDATLHTKADKHFSHPRITSFISATRNVMAVRLTNVSAMGAFNNAIDLCRTDDPFLPPAKVYSKGDTIWLEQKFPDGFSYILMVRIVPIGTISNTEMFHQTVQKKWWPGVEPSKTVKSRTEGKYAIASAIGDFDVFATVVTSLEAKDPLQAAKKSLAETVDSGFDKLHVEHSSWWKNFWPRSRISLKEPFLEQLWYTSLYNLASSMRGTPVPGLCGLWYGPLDTPSHVLPWKGYYTNDYNMQAPALAVQRPNHPELADGTFETVFRQLPQARRNARKLFKLEGAYYPLSTGPGGEEVTSGPYRFVQNSGPYWCTLLWRHYLFTGDDKFLRNLAYPIISDVCRFFARYLVWHEKEELYHLEISQAPELMYIHYSDPLATIAFLKCALKAAVAAAGKFACDAEERKKWEHILAHSPEYARYGDELPPLRGVRPNHHNHYQTMTALFPCGEFDPETNPEWKSVCNFEISKMMSYSRIYGCNKGNINGWTGLAYHIGMAACWNDDKSIAWRYFEDLLKANLKPNGLISHNPCVLGNTNSSEDNIKNMPSGEFYIDCGPQPFKFSEVLAGRIQLECTESLDAHDSMFPALEGPAMVLLLLGEMLLQSHNGVLRLFPALPDAKDGAFENFLAEGPTLVSSEKIKGKVRFIKLQSMADVSWRIRNPWPVGGNLWLKQKDKPAIQVRGKHYIDVTLRKNESLLVAEKKQFLLNPDISLPANLSDAQARQMTFADGMMAWLGKPKPSVYYTALERSRG